MASSLNHFFSLTPNTIFNAVLKQGHTPNGQLIPLNSYENRVYEIGLEDEEPIVAKFYRPNRWDIHALCDEHRFIMALEEIDFPVIKPLILKKHVSEIATVGKEGEFYTTFYPKFRGRDNAEINNDDRRWLGRLIARLHNVGEHFVAQHRLQLNVENYGIKSLESIISQKYLPDDLKQNVVSCIEQALHLIGPYFQGPIKTITVHGDCHLGNILWNKDGPHLLDFDDMVRAPAVQDLWLLFNGEADEVEKQKESFLEGYEIFRKFDLKSFILIEPLRTLRMIHHAAWIGNRYEEEAFKRAFPYYHEHTYWEKFLLSIKEQISLLQEPVYISSS